MTLGFIGCGNMANAIIGGILSSSKVDENSIIASDKNIEGLNKTKELLGINITDDNKYVASNSDIVFLSIKPQFYSDVIKEISPVIKDNTIIVTMAPGKDLNSIKTEFGKEVKVIRTMPNTPALVCEGMTAVCKNEFIKDEELEYVCSLLDSFGRTKIVPEYLMNAVVAVSGSAPAYVFLFIEAMADGAVKEGMPRDMAYEFASQTVLGSAKLLLETGKHPGELKDMVCSPGGTTIDAVISLEETGFRSSIIKAISACINKAKILK